MALRVGIMLPYSGEFVGGGYRFEQDVCEGLLEAVERSPHHFMLLGFDETYPHALPANASYVALPASRQLPARALRHARRTDANVRNALHQLGLTRRGVASEPELSEFLQRTGVQCVLHVGPRVHSVEVPFLVFVWDLEYRRQPYFPELSANGEWETRERYSRAVLPRAAAVVTGTEAGKQEIERFYGVHPDRLLLIPHPTPYDALRLAEHRSPAPARADHGQPTLLYPAQFWAHKNHVGLLHGLATLERDHGLRPRLLLTGSDQGNRAHVEDCARALGLTERVEFLGFVPRARLLELYTEVDALVYPTTFGPENLPPLEAFALSCPVAASRVPGALEQLGDAALLFDPLDADDMARTLARLLTDGALRASLIERGLTRARRWTRREVAAAMLTWVDSFAKLRQLWP